MPDDDREQPDECLTREVVMEYQGPKTYAREEKGQGIPRVIYAAKSTEDRRASIPEQLRECRGQVEGDPRRRLVAEYFDEAFSAYRRDRGPGLRDATQHAEDLAEEYEIAELWAQQSDRLARGDGRAARRTVEIALWALKHDVRVRTLQDPDAFRDLLFAVVTGQRNNEDSRRKGRASAAGRGRAAARGEYIGYRPGGYRLAIDVDPNGQILKRLVFDPDRQPLIELIFGLALEGKRSGAIAKAVTEAGWRTKPAEATCPACSPSTESTPS
jgi:DNA invertase Pin-like site-specific DNA recombinase